MNVLVLGGGGREHALVWSLGRSAEIGRLLVAPGNAGTARIAENVSVDAMSVSDVAAFCRREEVDLVVIGPEVPLAAGVADGLREAGVLVFGPGASGARLEGSKIFAKEFLNAAGVPTARAVVVDSVREAASRLPELSPRVVVKADGLAAGKGVVMARTREQALAAVRAAVEERRFGGAGARVLLEEWLDGEEASVIALVDGREIRPLVPSQDHKRVGDGDTGPNTGGMGAYAPYPGLRGAALDAAVRTCLTPVVEEMARRGIDYRGALYAGLMLTAEGPKVLEYNVRFGDPEAQVILPLFGGDFLETAHACARGRLSELPARDPGRGAALTVVAASAGYPVRGEDPREILGLEPDDDRGDSIVFHAGTVRDVESRVRTAGGRVLAVTGLGESLEKARSAAYDTLSTIRFEGMHFRKDIGARSLADATSKGAV